MDRFHPAAPGLPFSSTKRLISSRFGLKVRSVWMRFIPWILPLTVVAVTGWAWKTVRDAGATPQHQVVRGLLAEPDSLNPIRSTGMPDAIVQSHIFEGLIRLNDVAEPEPLLAKSWEEGMVATFFYGNETRAQRAFDLLYEHEKRAPTDGVLTYARENNAIQLTLDSPDSDAARTVFTLLPHNSLLPLVWITVQQNEAAPASMAHFLKQTVNEPAIVRAFPVASDRYHLVAAGEFESVIDELELYYEANPELEATIEVSREEAWLSEPYIRFHLRDDVRWQDGEPFDADDVVFTWQRIMDPVVTSPRRGDYKDIVAIQSPEAHEVVVQYRQPYSPAIETWAIGLLPEHRLASESPAAWTGGFDRAPIGTGPFQFKEWISNQRIVLERNPNWWQSGPLVEETVFLMIPDQLSLRIAFESGLTDFLEVEPHMIPRMRAEPDVAVSEAIQPQYDYVGWNSARPYFAQPEVRVALAHAVNVPGMIEALLAGEGTQSNGIYPPELWFSNRLLEPLPYDPAKAEAMLDAAGWKRGPDGIRAKDGVRFTFTLITNQGNNRRRDAASLIQSDLAKVGVEVSVETYEFAVLIGDKLMQNDFDAYLLGWASLLSFDQYLIWHSSQTKPGGLNRIGYENAKADRLMETLRGTFDREAIKRKASELQATIYQDQPYLFLYVPDAAFAWETEAWLVARPGDEERAPQASLRGLELEQPWLYPAQAGPAISAEGN